MTLRALRVAALALSTAIIAVAPAYAQSRSRMAYQVGMQQSVVKPTPQPAETLPPGHAIGSAMSSGDAFADDFVGNGYPSNGHVMPDHGYGACGCNDCNGGACGYGDCGCSSCGGYGCDDCCGGSGWSMLGGGCPPGQLYFTADYLFVRANFSEAISFLEQQEEQGNAADIFHSLDFRYEQSYRFGGGYRLCNCGDEVRFMFTRLSSTANDIAPFGSTIAYEVTSEPDGQTFIHADVDLKTYDVDFARRIQLGGNDCCDCCDPCCPPPCPAWDITWTGGFRFADVGWNRTYDAVDIDGITTTNAISIMDFRGGGVKVGLEGRRYFCGSGCFSVYMKGDISLLLGDVNLAAVRTAFEDGDPDIVTTQTYSTRQIIPVTEIETGLTGHITRNSSITTGYMFSAWHDLGFRDQFHWDALTEMETAYDDANILGFDGFFARLEVSF